MWRVQAVTAEGTAFTNRLGLVEAWRGLRDEALVEACGIEGPSSFMPPVSLGQRHPRRGPRDGPQDHQGTVSKHPQSMC